MSGDDGGVDGNHGDDGVDDGVDDVDDEADGAGQVGAGPDGTGQGGPPPGGAEHGADGPELSDGLEALDGEVDQGQVPSIAACANCGAPLSGGTCRFFHEIPTCPDCFHTLDLMRLAVAPPPEEDETVGHVLCDGIGPPSPSQLRRMAGLDKFAGLLPQGLGGELLASATSATHLLDAAAIVRAAMAARAVARLGTGQVKAEGGAVNILVHLAGLLTYEVAIAAMVRAGVVRRDAIDDGGEWRYEYIEDLPPGADPQSSYPAYALDMHASCLALLEGLEGVEGVQREHVDALRRRLEELLRS